MSGPYRLEAWKDVPMTLEIGGPLLHGGPGVLRCLYHQFRSACLLKYSCYQGLSFSWAANHDPTVLTYRGAAKSYARSLSLDEYPLSFLDRIMKPGSRGNRQNREITE